MITNLLITVSFSTGLLLSYQSSPQWIQLLNYNRNDIYSIKIDSKYGFPFVSIQLNGKKIDLMWDTGNMSRLAVTEEFANELELPVITQTNSYDSEGNLRGSSSVYRVDTIELFDQTWKNFRAVEFDHPEILGLAGPYFVKGKRFTLDYKNELIAITDNPLPQNHSGEQFPLVRSSKHELLIITYTEVNGHRVLSEIDTGKSRSVIDPRFAKKLGLIELEDGYKIEEVKIGAHTFMISSAKATKFDGISEGLPEKIQLSIGSDILSELLLTVDYNERVMMVQAN